MSIPRLLLLVIYGVAAFVGLMLVVFFFVRFQEPITFAVLVVAILGAVHTMLWSHVRARRAMARSHSYEETGALLREGAIVVHGEVVYLPGNDEAMRLDLTQEGTEARMKDGTWISTWTEVERVLTVKPFQLLREVEGSMKKQRIVVEPDADTSQLFDELEGEVEKVAAPSGGPPRRHRFAHLTPGERVWIAGRLEAGAPDIEAAEAGVDVDYRSNAAPPASWILRGAPRLLVSSLPLVEHFRHRASMHRRQLLWMLLAFVIPVSLCVRYGDRLFGETVEGTVQSSSPQYNKGRIVGYVASVEANGTLWSSESMTHSLDRGTPYTLRIGHLSSNDGEDTHWTAVESWMAMFGLGLWLAERALLGHLGRATLPWSRSTRPLVQRMSGRLDATATKD